ncbi:hypothetical protein PWT90_10106 [Aphanocladium album]|nr:hypothetical protein PWT90_10106 [Aphanocladium album]
MKLSLVIVALLSVATVDAWGNKRIQRRCETPENCAIKCADGAYYNKKMKKGAYALHCNGTHSDYRWGGMVCTQTVGPSFALTRTKCGWVNGTVCSLDEKAQREAVCVAEMELLDAYKLMCSMGKGRWSATADYPDIKNECPDVKMLYTFKLRWTFANRTAELTAALSSLEKIAWVRLSDETARFTVIPDMGSQVWASLAMDLIFENYHIQSAEASNTINLELPLQPLQRALKSALNSISASLRLTKKDGLPVLSLTITTTTTASGTNAAAAAAAAAAAGQQSRAAAGLATDDPFGVGDEDELFHAEHLETSLRREHEKIITQDIPVRVLHPETVETIMQPKVREPDVHIQLPPLLQLKAISDRFTKLAQTSAAGGGGSTAAAAASSSAKAPKLELSANMHGSLRLRIATDAIDIASVWSGLENPELDPAQLDRPLAEHPSTKFREDGPDCWATVRVDGKDWSRVLSVGRLEGRVIACFADDHALILYVYVPQYDDASVEDSVVTYYVQSYSS